MSASVWHYHWCAGFGVSSSQYHLHWAMHWKYWNNKVDVSWCGVCSVVALSPASGFQLVCVIMMFSDCPVMLFHMYEVAYGAGTHLAGYIGCEQLVLRTKKQPRHRSGQTKNSRLFYKQTVQWQVSHFFFRLHQFRHTEATSQPLLLICNSLILSATATCSLFKKTPCSRFRQHQFQQTKTMFQSFIFF